MQEFAVEKARVQAQVKRDLDEALVEASGLKKLVDIKTKELNYIKVRLSTFVCV